MKNKHDVGVIIDGKQIRLSAYENEEYLQKIASFLNNKHTEFKQQSFYRKLNVEQRNILMQINLVDDYFKLKQRVYEIEQINEERGKEIFELRHQAVVVQTRLDAREQELEALKLENIEMQKQIVRLETELKAKKE